MKKNTKAKKLSFRQRLRLQSAERLDKIASTMHGAGERACEESKTNIDPLDVMRLLSNTQTKSLREQLITELSNEVEAELEAIYNRQMDFIEDDKNDDD